MMPSRHKLGLGSKSTITALLTGSALTVQSGTIFNMISFAESTNISTLGAEGVAL